MHGTRTRLWEESAERTYCCLSEEPYGACLAWHLHGAAKRVMAKRSLRGGLPLSTSVPWPCGAANASEVDPEPQHTHPQGSF